MTQKVHKRNLYQYKNGWINSEHLYYEMLYSYYKYWGRPTAVAVDVFCDVYRIADAEKSISITLLTYIMHIHRSYIWSYGTCLLRRKFKKITVLSLATYIQHSFGSHDNQRRKRNRIQTRKELSLFADVMILNIKWSTW